MLLSVSLQAYHVRNPNLYQLSARPWLYELGVKKLSEVPDKVLDEIQSKGINAIYFLGVWKLGQFGLNHDRTDQGLLNGFKQTLPDLQTADIIGSPFAVVSYEMNSKEIGTNEDLKQFRARLAKRNIVLYLDFVPNHSAIDADHVTSNPKFFVQGQFKDGRQQHTNGIYFGKDKYNNVWTDTLQYNYFNPDTVNARIAELKKIAQMADGVRCDMAMLALNKEFEQIWGSLVYSQGYKKPAEEFWKRAIREVKQSYPNFKFMAEVYWNDGDDLKNLGFDYVYDKEGLYDALAYGNLDGIRNYIKYTNLDKGTHFVENHDEGRAAAHFGSNQRANAAGLVSFTLPGMKFHFQGQWQGMRNKLDIHLRRSYNPKQDRDQRTVELYEKLLPILGDDIWHEGKWEMKNVEGTESWRLMAWTYVKDNKRAVVVVNYSDQQGSGAVKLNVNDGEIAFHEKLSGQTYQRDGKEVREKGLFCIIGKWDAQIFYY